MHNSVSKNNFNSAEYYIQREYETLKLNSPSGSKKGNQALKNDGSGCWITPAWWMKQSKWPASLAFLSYTQPRHFVT